MRSLLYRYCNLSIVLLKDENIMNPDILNIDKRALEICEPIFEKMKEIVPEYVSNNSKYSVLDK